MSTTQTQALTDLSVDQLKIMMTEAMHAHAAACREAARHKQGTKARRKADRAVVDCRAAYQEILGALRAARITAED